MRKLEPRFWMFAGMLVAASLCLSLGIYSYNMTRGLFASATDVSRNWFPSVQAIDGIRAQLGQLRRAEGHILLAARKCATQACRQRIERVRTSLLQAEATYAPLVTPREESLMFETYKRQRAVYINLQDAVINGDTSTADAVDRFFSDSEEAYDNAAAALTQLALFNSAEGLKVHTESIAYFSRAQACMAVLNVVALCVAAALAVQLARMATGRVR